MNNSDTPAMPQEGGLFCKQLGQCPSEGMGLTKREYFAGLAMQGLCSDPAMAHIDHTAELAVKMADALLAELDKEPES